MDIVEELRQNRESGAKRLEAEYKAGLMTLARRFCHDFGDAEELVNRTFAAVVENIDDYLEQSAFFAWMCQILKNIHSLDTRRKSNKEIVYPGVVPDIADEDAQEAIYRSLDHSLVREALGTLDADDREVLLLHYFMDIPVPKLAQILAVPAGTVKSRLHYARKALAAKLGAKMKKTGAKAVLIALALCALTAAGAAGIARWGELSERAVAGGPRFVAAKNGGTGGTGETSGTGGSSPVAPVTTPVPPDSPVPPVPAVPFVPTPPSPSLSKETTMNKTTLRTLAASAAFAVATGAPLAASADDYMINVPLGETQTIDASLVAEIGAKNLVKTGRGTLVSSPDMAAYTGTITVSEGAFEIKTTSDLGTADGGTVVEDGGTLVVNMSSGQERFSNEQFTIAGTGDAAYGAAVYQVKSNDRFKLFKYLTLSGDATIYAGTRLGVDGGTLTMNGHTLTLKGVNFQFRDVTYASPIGDLVVEANTAFVRNQNATANATKTLTIRNGGRIGFAEANTAPSFWTLVVGEGGTIASFPSATAQWNGNVTWNSTTAENITGNISFNGAVTGTGTIKASSGTLAFAKPLGAGIGLGLSGTATAILPTADAYSYENAGLMIGRYGKSDAWWEFNNNRVTEWKLCLEGPGPQIDQLYWTKGWWGDATGSEGEESIGGNWSLGAKGYMWNRESTNVTFHVWCRVLYKTYVIIGSSTCFVARNNTIDTDNEVTIPANSCVPFLAMTAGSGSATPGLYNSTTGLKISGGNVLRDDGKGTLFTTSEVSTLETPALTTLALADDGALDANGMAMSVAALSGGGMVTNVTTLTLSDSWTLAAADVVAGDALTVHGDLAFGNGCAFDVTGLSNLELGGIYTVCTADAITGFATTEITDGHYKCELVQTGNRIDLVSIPKAMVLGFR